MSFTAIAFRQSLSGETILTNALLLFLFVFACSHSSHNQDSILELMSHQFFNDVDWDGIERGDLQEVCQEARLSFKHSISKV